jgi:hypothetical protein
MGHVKKARSCACRSCSQEAETERGWTQGDHRGHEAALGSGAKGASAVIKPGMAEGRDHLPSGGAGPEKRK